MPNFKITAVQASTVFKKDGQFSPDVPATVAEAVDYIKSASEQGSSVVVFPEMYLTGYPRGQMYGAVGDRNNGDRERFAYYQNAAVFLPKYDSQHDNYPVDNSKHAEIAQLCQAAKDNNIAVVVGVGEKSQSRPHGPIYCTAVAIHCDGTIAHKHRKVGVTSGERLAWARGTADTIEAFALQTPVGPLKSGMLICWENLRPEFALKLITQGVEALFAITADGRESWQATMLHRAAEMNCVVAGVNMYATVADVFGDCNSYDHVRRQESCAAVAADDALYLGGTCLCGPFGDYLGGGEPLRNKQGLVTAEFSFQLLKQRATDAGHGQYKLTPSEVTHLLGDVQDGYNSSDDNPAAHRRKRQKTTAPVLTACSSTVSYHQDSAGKDPGPVDQGFSLSQNNG